MTVRRQQVITLNVPIDILVGHVNDMLRGNPFYTGHINDVLRRNPFYRDVDISEDRKEFTFTTATTLQTFSLRWSIQLSSKGTQTLVTVANVSLPSVTRDLFNAQNRYITELLTRLQSGLQAAADQTLLRASEAPPAKSDTLLRPADAGTATAKEELLRPDQSEC